jgi:hypothetical protein
LKIPQKKGYFTNLFLRGNSRRLIYYSKIETPEFVAQVLSMPNWRLTMPPKKRQPTDTFGTMIGYESKPLEKTIEIQLAQILLKQNSLKEDI